MFPVTEHASVMFFAAKNYCLGLLATSALPKKQAALGLESETQALKQGSKEPFQCWVLGPGRAMSEV